jgi:hypothetical protein
MKMRFWQSRGAGALAAGLVGLLVGRAAAADDLGTTIEHARIERTQPR